MMNSAVSAKGIITFLINLSNLLHLFFLLHTESLKFPVVYIQLDLQQKHEKW